MTFVPALRSLVIGHRGARSTPSSRIGSVIRDYRPSYVVRAEGLENAGQTPRDFTEEQISAMTELALSVRQSIGLIEVRVNDDWVPSGTCFRVGERGHSVLTAGHMLKGILKQGAQITGWNPLEHDGSRYEARVRFGPPNDSDSAVKIVNIASYRWAHPGWDMLLCELGNSDAEDSEAKALSLADSQTRIPTGHPICVIGYPLKRRHEARSVFDDLELEQHPLRAAPGLVTAGPGIESLPDHPDATIGRETLAHDASTLPGNSGSPVFDLISRQVIGLHFDGGDFERDPARTVSDPNRAVYLPLALTEDFLAAELTRSATAASPSPLPWRPELPPWKPSLSLLGAEADFPVILPEPRGVMLGSLVPDRADFRDRIYRSPLLEAKDELLPSLDSKRRIRNQYGEGACTGFALAAAINLQLDKLGRSADPVSERMLYEMARLNDEWLDDAPEGTSLRAVIKGFYQNGVCLDRTSPYQPGVSRWTLSIDAAHEARAVTLGAYYRLRPDLLDFQLALNETGAIIVSAKLHSGWLASQERPMENIAFVREHVGNHAFVILGYDRDGFIIQNSWGESWGAWRGQPGLAHWHYADWAENLIDAWVLRLAPSTPDAFDLVPQVARYAPTSDALGNDRIPVVLPRLARPRRFSLIGHSVRIERDRFVNRGRLGMGLDSLRETALYLGSQAGRKKYSRIALFFHDPQLGSDTLLRLGAHQLKPFKAHGIYPLHIYYGLDEGYTLRLRSQDEAAHCRKLLAQSGEPMSPYLDRRARDILNPLYRLFQQGIEQSIQPGGPLWQAIASIVLELSPSQQSICLYADGLGFSVAEAAGRLIRDGLDLTDGKKPVRVDRQFLLAPVCSVDELEAQTIKTRAWSLALSSRDAAIESDFEGYWADLAYRAGHDTPSRSDAIRFSEGLTASENNAGTVELATLHEAAADSDVLNDCLALFAGRLDPATSF